MSFIYGLVLVALFAPSLCFLDSMKDWFFGEKDQEKIDGSLNVRKKNQFEIISSDENFLKLANALNDLSPLDACYHIVIYSLKKRCGELSEEELGKVSVQLLNCQSQSENRPVFKCTADMTIAECTKDMDSSIWHTYQIVGNRARAMCYSAQQQQFRRMTEMAVNDLATTAEGQLKYMEQLQDGQEQLHSLTSETVRKLYESQKDLLGNQKLLQGAQDDVLGHISSNIKELIHEKALISTGNKELAEMTENIKQKLDLTAQKLLVQEKDQHESHDRIIQDLTEIQVKAHDALNKLDNSSMYLLKNHKEMVQHYQMMYSNMERINNTVLHLLSTVNNMQANLDERISWISHVLGVAEDKLSLLTSVALHLGYFLLAALVASFLQIPSLSRLLLFLTVLLNAVMEIQYEQSLDFINMTIFILLSSGANYIFLFWRGHDKISFKATYPSVGVAPSTSTTPPRSTHLPELEVPLSPEEIRNLTSTLGRLYNCLNESLSTSAVGEDTVLPLQSPRINQSHRRAFTPINIMGSPRVESPSVREDVDNVRRILLNNMEDASSVGSSRASTPIRCTPRRSSSRASNSTTSSFKCLGTTRTGTPCRRSVGMSEYCPQHRLHTDEF